MSIPPTLLDSDVLSAIMRRHPTATTRSRAYLLTHVDYSIPIVVRFEVLRGLKAKGAIQQLAKFDELCNASEILPLTEPIVIQAADIYADLHRRGVLVGDIDILIAATAMVHGLVVATNNERHFRRIPGLVVDNWLQ